MKSVISMMVAMNVLAAVYATTTLSPGKPNTITSVSGKASSIAFLHFVTHRQANGAALMWTVSSPADVVGFDIERSYDGDIFDVVASQTPGNASLFRCKDTNVYPGFIHYRIKAYLNDGSVVYSGISVVRIVARRV
jgi:hypothetical protein